MPRNPSSDTRPSGPSGPPRGTPESRKLRRRHPVVTCQEGDVLHVAAVLEGAVDLDRTHALRGAAMELWRALEEPRDEEALAHHLATRQACSREEAASAVRGFAAQARATGLVEGGPDEAPAADAPGPEPSAGLGAAAAEALARAALDAGHALRFRARGLSMRPQVPHGSLIEVRHADAGELRRGCIALYCTPEHRLVAHRVIGRRQGLLLLRGDSAARIDAVPEACVLGRVTARLHPLPSGGSRPVPLDTFGRRLLGRAWNRGHRTAVAAARLMIVKPLRGAPPLRRLVRGGLRVLSAGLRFAERAGAVLRRRVDVVRAALLTTGEKDAGRQRLYRHAPVVGFTALDENVQAGLTLIEEVLLARHPLPPGSAVLVVGCGPGREAVALARRGHRVTGVDREPAMLVCARELAAREGLEVHWVEGEALRLDPSALDGPAFDAATVFSGLINMVQPRARRVAMLRGVAGCLKPGGRILLTFLSDYAPPGADPSPGTGGLLRAVNPDHEEGDRFLLNEVVHIHPRGDDLAREAEEAGLRVLDLHRDQRAYDRATRQVRGFAVLVREA